MKRESFNSNLGFVLASAGAAVGLGNLWKFPYLAGNLGGGLFVLIYFVFLIVFGAPLMLSEMALGRYTEKSPFGAFETLKKGCGAVGSIGVLCAFIVLCFYSVVGGWVIRYFFGYLFGIVPDFDTFSANALEPTVFHVLFALLTFFIVLKGISGGIEKISKLFLPALFVILCILAIYAASLPGAKEGIEFFLVPRISNLSDLPKICINAMGQVFFSLSLGMGAIITYGSYLSKSANLPKNAVVIPVLDTAVAFLSGILILSAVFAFGLEPQGGEGLLFRTMPAVFAYLPFSRFWGALFFLMVFFAAITSSVSLLEVVTSFLMDTFRLKRSVSALIPIVLVLFIGALASLSFGILKPYTIAGYPFFTFLTVLTDKYFMPASALLLCIFTGYVWDKRLLINEITNGHKKAFRFEKAFLFVLRYAAPVIILIVFFMSL